MKRYWPALLILFALLLDLCGTPARRAEAAESSGFNAVVLPGDLGFGAGGIDGHEIIIASWSATEDYPINTIIQHGGFWWAATADPAVGDEPGVSSNWLRLITNRSVQLSDMPSAITDGRFLKGTGTNTYELVTEPANNNTFPHVGRLPDATDPDSPILVYLTHDEFDGAREDATMTVGQSLGQYCGYSRGNIFDSFGALSKPSPIEMIFGIWDGTDCTIQTVHSSNEGFIDDIRSVIFTVGSGTEMTCQLGSAFQEYGYQTKRAVSCPGLQDIALGDVTINFLYADGTSAYWTDGSIDHRAGLYERLGTPPTYHDLAPPEDAHKTGEGSAACGDTEPPDAAGQLCVTSDGRGYFAMPRTTIVTTQATIDVSAAGSAYFIPDIYLASELQARNNLSDGDFLWVRASQEFYQFQDPDFETVSWTEAWQYIVDNVSDTATTQAFLTSQFLGDFASEAEVLRDRDGYDTPVPALGTATITGGAITDIAIDYGGLGYTAAPTITIGAPGGTGTQATATATITDGVVTAVTITEAGTGYTAAPTVTFANPTDYVQYYFLYIGFGALIAIDEFTYTTREDVNAGFAWRGPVIISEEVLEIVEANEEDAIDEALDALQVGSRQYSVIVRAGSNGELRSAVASDFDTSIGKSKVVGFDGDWKEVGRRLVPGHAASATDQITDDGDTVVFDGRTYRYRDEHHGDRNVHNARNLDYYYDLVSHRFRWCFTTAAPPAACRWSEMHTDAQHFDGAFYQSFNFLGYFDNRHDALSHATASGQSAVYATATGYDFNRFDNVVVAVPDDYTYFWRFVVPPAAAFPSNVALVDDGTYTWTGANHPGQEVHFSRALTEADDGRPVLIDYRPNAAGSDNRAAGAVILSEHIRHLTTLRPMMLQKTGGGDTPIDHTIDLPAHRPGSIEFPFPISSGGNERRWMRMYYIGDHVDDLDGSFGTGTGTTTLTLDSTTGITTDTDYWISGPVEGGGCTLTRHDEKVTVTAIGTPNPDDITVIRGVDGTTISDDDCDTFASGADFIEDNKTTFVLAATHDDQDSGDFTFTLLAQGVGGSGSGGESGGGSGILKAKYAVSSSTLVDVDDTTWQTVLTQTLNVPLATDRVYIDAQISVQAQAGDQDCNIRALRDSSTIGSVTLGHTHHSMEIQNFSHRVMDTPGAGEHTYEIQVQSEDTDDCEVNHDGSFSFASFEVLATNP